jgi:hypothetical protein
MNVDLTTEEMRYILETVGAGDTTKPVVSSIVNKMNAACRAVPVSDTPLPEPGPDPRVSAQQWKAPI